MSALEPLPEAADPTAFRRWLTSWITSDAMAHLAEASGWRLNGNHSTDELLDELVRLSSSWDFRSGAERHLITSHHAEVNGRTLDEDLVRRYASELGLVGGMPLAGSYTDGVALGGMVKACLNRARLLHDLQAEHSIARLVMLAAHRPIQGRELDDVAELGWGSVSLESEAALLAAREAFQVSADPDFEDNYPGDDPPAGVELGTVSPEEYRRRTGWSLHRWRTPQEIAVVAAPSSAPLRRRANTADQLGFWADRCGVSGTARILLVTTEHYVPYQQLQALLSLGRSLGCRTITTGTSWSPAGSYSAAGYLQEIRATISAAQELRDALALPIQEKGRVSRDRGRCRPTSE